MTFATIAINDDPWQFELLPPRCSHCSDLDDYRLVYFCSSGKVLREGAAWGPGGAPAIHRQHRQTTGLARAHRHRRWREPQTALDLTTTPIRDPVRRVLRRVLGPHPGRPSYGTTTATRPNRPTPRSPWPAYSGTRPAAAARAPRRIERRRPVHLRIPRRRTRRHRPGDRVPRQPQPGRDRPDRQALSAAEIPDLRHSCNVIGPFDPGWVAVLKERRWPTFQGAPTPVASAAVVSPSHTAQTETSGRGR